MLSSHATTVRYKYTWQQSYQDNTGRKKAGTSSAMKDLCLANLGAENVLFVTGEKQVLFLETKELAGCILGRNYSDRENSGEIVLVQDSPGHPLGRRRSCGTPPWRRTPCCSLEHQTLQSQQRCTNELNLLQNNSATKEAENF